MRHNIKIYNTQYESTFRLIASQFKLVALTEETKHYRCMHCGDKVEYNEKPVEIFVKWKRHLDVEHKIVIERVK